MEIEEGLIAVQICPPSLNLLFWWRCSFKIWDIITQLVERLFIYAID